MTCLALPIAPIAAKRPPILRTYPNVHSRIVLPSGIRKSRMIARFVRAAAFGARPTSKSAGLQG